MDIETRVPFKAPLLTLKDLQMYPIEKESSSPFKDQENRLKQAVQDGRVLLYASCSITGNREEPPLARLSSLAISDYPEITEAVMEALTLEKNRVIDSEGSYRQERTCAYQCLKDRNGKGPFLVETKVVILTRVEDMRYRRGMILTVTHLEE